MRNEASPARETDNSSQPGLSAGPWLVAFLIVAAAAAPALNVWAGNVAQIPKTYGVFLVAGGFALLGFLTFWLLRRWMADTRVAAFLTFFILLILSSGGQIMRGSGWLWTWVAGIGAMAAAALIVTRLRHWWVLDAIVIAAAAALVLPSLLTGLSATIGGSGETNGVPASAPMPRMIDRPDIVFVVVDGYTSLPVLRELFGFADATLEDDLASNGFDVVETVFSPYSMTHLAVSSLLELDYVAPDGPATSTEDGRTLFEVMGGNSFLVGLLAENAYRITMVEPGWHMSTCGDEVDVCVPAPFIDEGVGLVLSQSLLWSFVEPSVGSAFTNGARNAMDWATENIEALVTNQTPDFIFVHVLVPHPPLVLDAGCRVVSEDRRLLGDSVNQSGVPPETALVRREGYVGQVECVNDFVRDLAESVSGTEALVFVTGDHGSDAMSQLVTDPAQWSAGQVLERMSVFLAVKATPGCDDQPSLVTVQMFRELVSCAGRLDLDPIEEKSFLVSLAEIGDEGDMRKVEAAELRQLARCLERLDGLLEC